MRKAADTEQRTTVPDRARSRLYVPPPPVDGSRFTAGTLLGDRYRIVSLLGQGGMGEVYRAEDLRLETAVAIKLLPEPLERAPEWLEQLGQEVKIARQVTHANVCRIYDLGDADGLSFLSMEYIAGDDLRTLLRKSGHLRQERAVEIGLGICHGLAAAHEQGILHRDLKPGNVMVDHHGQARITDFGLAAWIGSIRGSRARDGTPAYMAPEQKAGGEVTVQSDLFALGLVLYELFTGERLDPETSPSDAFEDVGPAVRDVVLCCLAEDPAERPGSAQEVAQVLETRRPSSWVPAPGLTIPKRPRWILEKKLGHGGFGDVWLARHEKTREARVFKFCHDSLRLRALRREIMLFRILKEELGERDDVARIFDWDFESPPYFIESEYTEDGDLEEWSRRQGGLATIPLATRLEIVAQVATALSAAHAVGVLHKDVKPRNVLIRDPEEKASAERGFRAQLSDFGVGVLTERDRLVAAGITDVDLTEKLGSSDTGTRLYMAPELVEGKPATVRADTYALGVMLYQMVVGDFSRALAPGWQRDVDDELLREDVAAAVDGSPERRLDALRLAERLRDLEGRRARCEAERREKEEAERLRAVLAQSRKRRRVLAVAVAVLLVFGGAMTFMTFQVLDEKQRVERVAGFLEELFKPIDPFGTENPDAGRGKSITVEQLLDQGMEKLELTFEHDPEIRIQLLETLGRIYLNLALFERAEQPLVEALTLRRQALGDEHPDVVRGLNDLADLSLLRGDYEKADSFTRQALELSRRIGEPAGVATSLTNRANWYYNKGDYDEAEPLYRKALEIRQGLGDKRLDEVATSIENLAIIHHEKGSYDEAEMLYREALKMRRQLLGDEHPDVATSLTNLARLLQTTGNYDEAERLLREALEIKQRLLGGEHLAVATGLNNLAGVLHQKGDYEEAEPRYRRALALNRKILGNEHFDVAINLSNLAELLRAQGDYEAAEPLCREALKIKRLLVGEEHPGVATSLNNLALLLHAKGDYEGAEPLYDQALGMRRRLLGNEHSAVASSLSDLARLRLARGQAAEAEALIRQALEVYYKTLPPSHWRIANAKGILGASLAAHGRYQEAEPLLVESYPVVRGETGKRSPYTREILEHLVGLYDAWGQPEEAARYRVLRIEAGGSP